MKHKKIKRWDFSKTSGAGMQLIDKWIKQYFAARDKAELEKQKKEKLKNG